VVREPNPDEVVAIAQRHVDIGAPIIVSRLLDVVADLRDENADLYKKAYLTIRLPKFLRRTR